MKRIAGIFMLLAGLNGCTQTTNQATTRSPFAPPARPAQTSNSSPPAQPPQAGSVSAMNRPPAALPPGLMPGGFVAGSNPKAGSDLIQMGYLEVGPDDDAEAPGKSHKLAHAHQPPLPFYDSKRGVVPVPYQNPPGAVSAIGALPARMPMAPTNMRTSVNFASPDGMRVTWFGPQGWQEPPLITPARYNFLQGGVYRLRMSSVANRLEKVYYPTLEVVPGQETSSTYLAHSAVPVTFTDDDFEQVDSGNFLVKVIYLPNPTYQDLATVVGPNELISTRLEPGIDPIVEAQKRGTILAIIRLGNIDLNVPNSPAMDAPNPFMMGQRMMPPMMPPMGAPLPPPGTQMVAPEAKEFKPEPKELKLEPKELKVEPKESKVEPKELKVEPKESKVEPKEIKSSPDLKDFKPGPELKDFKPGPELKELKPEAKATPLPEMKQSSKAPEVMEYNLELTTASPPKSDTIGKPERPGIVPTPATQESTPDLGEVPPAPGGNKKPSMLPTFP